MHKIGAKVHTSKYGCTPLEVLHLLEGIRSLGGTAGGFVRREETLVGLWGCRGAGAGGGAAIEGSKNNGGAELNMR